MAPKGRKRPAAAAKGPSPKKQCKAITSALSQAELPPAVVKTLKLAAPLALTTYAEARHPVQVSIVGMVENALKGVQAGLEKVVADATATVSDKDGEKARREAAILQAGKELVASKTEEAALEYKVYEAVWKYKKVKDVLASKTKDQKKGDTAYHQIAATQKSFEELKAKIAEMKGTKCDAKACSKLAKELKGFGVDTSLIDSLHVVFSKDPAERGEFDSTIVGQLNAELATKTADFAAKIQVEEPGKATREAAVAAAQGAYDTAKEALTTAKAGLAASGQKVADGEKSVKVAKDKFTHFDSDMKQLDAKLVTSKKELADFTSDALGSFASLKALTAPVPEPEVVEPAAAAPTS